MSEPELKAFEYAKALLPRRAQLYITGVQTTVLRKDADGWRNLLTKLHFVCKGRPAPEPVLHNYRDVIIARRLVAANDIGPWLERLLNEGALGTGVDPGVVPLQARFPINNSYRLNGSEWTRWPAEIFTIEPSSDQFRVSPFDRSLVALDAPYYPSFKHVLLDFFGVRSLSWSQYFRGEVIVVLPDFRVRVSRLTLGLGFLKTECECVGLEPSQLIAKVYAESALGVLAQQTLHLTEPGFQLDLNDKATFASVALVCKASGESLDERSFHEGWGWQEPEVVVEISEPEIEQMILLGEGETLEFREKLDKGKPERLAKTVVAFANTKGGVIVFGVDDDHHVVGCETKGLADTVTNILRSYCEPPPSTTIEMVHYNDKELFLVRVAESQGTIHTVKDLGTFIRASATNRAPNSRELENLYRRRVNPNLPLRLA